MKKFFIYLVILAFVNIIALDAQDNNNNNNNNENPPTELRVSPEVSGGGTDCSSSEWFCSEKIFRCEYNYNDGCEYVCIDTAGVDCVSDITNWIGSCSPASCLGTRL